MRLVATAAGDGGAAGAAVGAGAPADGAASAAGAASAGAAGASAGSTTVMVERSLGGIGGRGGHLRGLGGRARGQRNLVERPVPAFAVQEPQGAAAGGAGLEREERRVRNGADARAVEVVVVDLEAGVRAAAGEEHDAVVVHPRGVVDRIIARGQRYQQPAVARVEQHDAKPLAVEARRDDPLPVGRDARVGDVGAVRLLRDHAHRSGGDVQLGQIVMVAVGAREHVAAAVGAERSAAAAQIAKHDRQRAGVDVVAVEPRRLVGGIQIQRDEIQPAPVGREAEAARQRRRRDRHLARRQHVGEIAFRSQPPVGRIHREPGGAVQVGGEQRFRAVGGARVAGAVAGRAQHALLGRTRAVEEVGGHLVGELVDQRRQGLVVRLPEAKVHPQRKEDRPRLDVHQPPQLVLAVAIGEEAHELAARQVVAAGVEVALEDAEIAAVEALAREAGGEGAAPERPHQPPGAGLQLGLVVDGQPLGEPRIDPDLRRVHLAEQVPEPGEPGDLLELHVVRDLVTADGGRIGRQSHLQRKRVERVVGRHDRQRFVAGEAGRHERVVERQLRQDHDDLLVGHAVVDLRGALQVVDAALDARQEPPRLDLAARRVVDEHVVGLDAPHRILGDRGADLLGQARRRDRNAPAGQRGRCGQKGSAGRAGAPKVARPRRHRAPMLHAPSVLQT